MPAQFDIREAIDTSAVLKPGHKARASNDRCPRSAFAQPFGDTLKTNYTLAYALLHPRCLGPANSTMTNSGRLEINAELRRRERRVIRTCSTTEGTLHNVKNLGG
jgi:hypothetical protein